MRLSGQCSNDLAGLNMKQDQNEQGVFLYLNVDNVIILIIIMLNFLLVLSTVLYCRPVPSRSFWLSILLRCRLLLPFVDLLYISWKLLIEKKRYVPFFFITIFCYLGYICIPSMLFYFAGYKELISNAFSWPLTFVAYYLYIRDNFFTPLFRTVFVLGCLACALAMIIALRTKGMTNSYAGSVYQLISFIPMCLFLLKGRSRWIIFCIIALLTLFSLKRAGTITIALGFIAYYLCTFRNNNKKTGGILKGALVAILFFLIGGAVLPNLEVGQNILRRFDSLSEDGGSGRSDIWENVLRAFKQSPYINKIVGHGYHALPIEVRPDGNVMYAHNSYLETLYDLGLIGFVWLIMIVLVLLLFLIKMIFLKNGLAPIGAFAMCIIIMFSMFSYFFDECGTILMIASFWGIFMGQCDKSNTSTIQEKRRHLYLK